MSLALQADSLPLGRLGSPFYDIDLAKNSFVTAYRKARMNFLANAIHKFIVVQSQVVSDSCQPPWTAARQASLSLTISWSLPKLAHKQMRICKCSIPLSTPLFFHKWQHTNCLPGNHMSSPESQDSPGRLSWRCKGRSPHSRKGASLPSHLNRDWQVDGEVVTAMIGCNAHHPLGIVKRLQGCELGAHCPGDAWADRSVSPLSTLCHLHSVTWSRLRISGWVIPGEAQHSQIQ